MANIAVIRKLLDEHGVGAALITFLPDIRWACGFTGSNGVLVVRREEAHFVTDGRYRGQARQEVRGATVHIPGYELFKHIAGEALLAGAGRVLFQAEHVTVAQLAAWKGLMPSVAWQPAENLLTRSVAAKTPEEIERIRQAQAISDAVFRHLLDVIKPGMTEREVAAEIVYHHLRRGAARMAFDPIVASGPNGALPHARPTGRRLAPGELVVLDFGCFLDGYASDMTRTIALGEPGDEARRVYGFVQTAQQRAIEAAQAGITTKALDRVARSALEQAGYGAHFMHGLGHGIGLQTHEWPRVSYHVEEEIPAGAAITIEPGVYLPGRFGVRIEDIVVLRAGGCDNLTTSPKDLLVL